MKKMITITAALSVCFSVTAFANTNKVGQKTYSMHCVACHAPAVAVALKAPALHNAKDWAPRIANAEKESKADPKKYPTALDYLVDKVKHGLGAMPPGGMCIDQSTKDKQCTRAVYAAAIEYMSGMDKKK